MTGRLGFKWFLDNKIWLISYWPLTAYYLGDCQARVWRTVESRLGSRPKAEPWNNLK